MAFNLFPKSSILTPQERRQQKLIYLLIAVVLITAGVLYFGYFGNPSAPSEGGPAVPTPPEGESLAVKSAQRMIKKIDFDVDFLKSSSFQSLKSYGEWPLSVGEKGRANPFLPY